MDVETGISDYKKYNLNLDTDPMTTYTSQKTPGKPLVIILA